MIEQVYAVAKMSCHHIGDCCWDIERLEIPESGDR